MKFLTFMCLTVFVAAFCILPARAEDIEEGLVGYWKFNEGEGEAASDSSGMDNHGELFGDIAWVQGQFGGALEFTESQSCVRIEHSDTLDLTEELTIALWASPEETQPDWGKLFCKNKTDGYPYVIQYDADNRFKLAVYIGGGEIGMKSDSFVGWGHVALVFDGTDLVFYKDGEEAVRTPAAGELLSNEEPVTIGSRWESDQSFLGAIDDVRIYNRVLSQDEIKQIMEGEITAAVTASGKLTSAWGLIKGR